MVYYLGIRLCLLSIPHDSTPLPQNISGGAIQHSTQDHTAYHRTKSWIVGEEIPCATHSEVRMAPDRVCIIIVACCILHKLAVNLREPELEDCEMDDEGCAADLHA